MSATETARHVRVAPLMGTVFSAHVLGDEHKLPARTRTEVDLAIAASFAELGELERVFSPYLADSDLSRLRDGRASIDELDPRLAEVERECLSLERETAGRFSAWREGWFDPTGYVKGWAAEQVACAHLRSLLELDDVAAVGLNAGGDVRVFTADGWAHPWRIGVADPLRPGAIVANIELRDGAVATSGLAERGEHILDPRTGRPATALASATVVADTLTLADVWATTAIVAGDELGWITDAPVRSGLTVGRDGRIRRWANGVELSPVAELTGSIGAKWRNRALLRVAHSATMAE